MADGEQGGPDGAEAGRHPRRALRLQAGAGAGGRLQPAGPPRRPLRLPPLRRHRDRPRGTPAVESGEHRRPPASRRGVSHLRQGPAFPHPPQSAGDGLLPRGRRPAPVRSAHVGRGRGLGYGRGRWRALRVRVGDHLRDGAGGEGVRGAQHVRGSQHRKKQVAPLPPVVPRLGRLPRPPHGPPHRLRRLQGHGHRRLQGVRHTAIQPHHLPPRSGIRAKLHGKELRGLDVGAGDAAVGGGAGVGGGEAVARPAPQSLAHSPQRSLPAGARRLRSQSNRRQHLVRNVLKSYKIHLSWARWSVAAMWCWGDSNNRIGGPLQSQLQDAPRLRSQSNHRQYLVRNVIKAYWYIIHLSWVRRSAAALRWWGDSSNATGGPRSSVIL